MLHKLIPAFLFIIAPIVYSPGPANLTFAALGGTLKFNKVLPFLLGVWFTTISGLILCLYGMTDFLTTYDVVIKYMPLFGGLYLLYMAINSLRNVKQVEIDEDVEVSHPSFIEGVIFQALNPKFLVFTVSVYAPFLKEGFSFLSIYTVLLFFGGASAHLLWYLIGGQLAKVLGGKVAQYAFSILLIFVAGWMVYTALI